MLGYYLGDGDDGGHVVDDPGVGAVARHAKGEGGAHRGYAARRHVAGELKRYEYPRWQFVNHSDDIRGWCTEVIDLVGVPWRQSSWKTISVSTRAGVARLDELIGPKR